MRTLKHSHITLWMWSWTWTFLSFNFNHLNLNHHGPHKRKIDEIFFRWLSGVTLVYQFKDWTYLWKNYCAANFVCWTEVTVITSFCGIEKRTKLMKKKMICKWTWWSVDRMNIEHSINMENGRSGCENTLKINHVRFDGWFVCLFLFFA